MLKTTNASASAPCQDHELLYLIGQPGAGKSSLFATLLAGVPYRAESQPFAHMVYSNEVVQLGANRPYFSGTDALSLNVQPKVVTWLRTAPYHHVIAEGDRLGNAAFFQAVRALGWNLTVAYLDAPGQTLAERRAQRDSHQNPTWLKGRQTKVIKLAAQWASLDYWLDGSLPLETLAPRLAAHPCFAGIIKEPTHAAAR